MPREKATPKDTSSREKAGWGQRMKEARKREEALAGLASAPIPLALYMSPTPYYGMDGLGDRIRTARLRAGLSQAELADELGTTQSVVSKWESGARVPNAESVGRLASTLSVSTDWLLGLDVSEAGTTRCRRHP